LTISVVLADANILYSRTLRDYFLYAADEGAIEIHRSQQILDEMSRNLRENLGLGASSTARLEELMTAYIEYALIDVEPEDLATVDDVEMDAKDRHVLAAALSVDADILLTENIRHFPQWMTDHGIELLTPAELLAPVVARFPDRIRAAHATVVRHSPKPEAEVLATLEAIIGREAVGMIRTLMQAGRELETPGEAIEE
jgi:predicted nucleic acid-binding protein